MKFVLVLGLAFCCSVLGANVLNGKTSLGQVILVLDYYFELLWVIEYKSEIIIKGSVFSVYNHYFC